MPDIPSMGGAKIGPVLTRLAEQVDAGRSIVEIGTWLGAGAAHLAGHAPLCCYDRWRANGDQVRKARRFGVTLEAGQDTLPIARAMLGPLADGICFHQGEIQRAEWHGRPIGLYVDDACKTAGMWKRAMKTFGPSFVPGETVLVLMDYHYDEKGGPGFRAQKRYVRHHAGAFTCLAERLGDGSTAVFRFEGFA